MNLLKDLYANRRLIRKLSKNDFKTRYAGSYLGIIWAFVQPVITILVYWFVFQKALKVGNSKTTAGIDIPYVLWLTTGLVPWFFFSEALNNGTNALIEYNYLVKKVVFNISILPVIKLLSALIVHVFFVFFTLVLFGCYGFFPDLYTLQVLYYSFALFVLCLGIAYATCSVVIFFRDLTQIISIALQVGMWATPILWNLETTVPGSWQWIFKANPVYYIVKGYRDALIDKQWFWQDWKLTLYFWAVTILIYGIGNVIFVRLKPHFADVL